MLPQLNYPGRARLLDHDAAEHAKPPARMQTERPCLTAEQSTRLLEITREHDPELLPLVTMAVYTGLRIGVWKDSDGRMSTRPGGH
jgi:hypothetical protein